VEQQHGRADDDGGAATTLLEHQPGREVAEADRDRGHEHREHHVVTAIPAAENRVKPGDDVPGKLVELRLPARRRHSAAEPLDNRQDRDDDRQYVGGVRFERTLGRDDADAHHHPGQREQQVEILGPLGLVNRVDDTPQHHRQERN
jgi:hypothetical protein